MFYHIFYELLYQPDTIFSICRIFQYITVRAACAMITALFITLILTPILIKKLDASGIKQVIREEYLPNHVHKRETPTMGGLVILIAILISAFLWARLDNRFVFILIQVTLWMGLLGFLDDYMKWTKKSEKGLIMWYKLIGQILISTIVAFYLYSYPIHLQYPHSISIPFTKGIILDLGWFYIPFVVLVIVSASNAVNITDGLDGLAIGAIIFAGLTFIGLSYIISNYKFCEYLKVIFISGSGEITVFLSGVTGASVGFLWYNAHPAEIFMGDTGSLSLGAILGTIAILIKHELVLLIAGGLFVIEAGSVIFQVASFKFRGKRIFNMAPLHHHFELEGWGESKIIVRFWIIAGMLALLSLTTLKLR